MRQLLIEAVIVGVGVVVLGSLIGFILGHFFSVDLPIVCKEWNKYYVMELSLFLTGVVFHIICEYVGINKWYCKNSYACTR